MYSRLLCTLALVVVASFVQSIKISKNGFSGIEYHKGRKLFPKSFSECVDFITNSSNTRYIQDIQEYCLDGFISIDHTHDWVKNFTKDEQNYIRSIFRKIVSDASNVIHRNRRHKRSVPLFAPRIRREVRAMPHSTWLDYARNVRRLKYEVISRTGRNKYDILADIHGTAINSAHFGPNFLPWHRLYLLIFETALGVPLPYFDSTIDFECDRPEESILWSSKYFGNGFGVVRTGPFAYFQTPVGPLIRNIGSDGSLMSFREVSLIFTRYRLAQISEPTAAEQTSLEGQHNGVHIWIDGQMNNLELSPHEPVFWTHHSFIDYIWELFRSLQYKRGIDPTIDFVTPPDNVTLQNVTDAAVGLTGYYNSDGYSKPIANLVQYYPHPQCPHCSNSPDLYCNPIRNRCISRLRNPFEFAGSRDVAFQFASENGLLSGGSKNRPFSLYNRDDRVRGDSLTMNSNGNTQAQYLMSGNGGNFGMNGMSMGIRGGQNFGSMGMNIIPFNLNQGRQMNIRQPLSEIPFNINPGIQMNTRQSAFGMNNIPFNINSGIQMNTRQPVSGKMYPW